MISYVNVYVMNIARRYYVMFIYRRMRRVYEGRMVA